jgi:hypothetical protein
MSGSRPWTITVRTIHLHSTTPTLQLTLTPDTDTQPQGRLRLSGQPTNALGHPGRRAGKKIQTCAVLRDGADLS